MRIETVGVEYAGMVWWSWCSNISQTHTFWYWRLIDSTWMSIDVMFCFFLALYVNIYSGGFYRCFRPAAASRWVRKELFFPLLFLNFLLLIYINGIFSYAIYFDEPSEWVLLEVRTPDLKGVIVSLAAHLLFLLAQMSTYQLQSHSAGEMESLLFIYTV